MRRATWLVAIGAALAVLSAQAVMAEAQPNGQQEKMKTCSADAKSKGLKGDERKSYMKTCLSAGSTTGAEPTANTQQEKMKSCNADAKTKGLKGDDRKAFMKSCLSGAEAH